MKKSSNWRASFLESNYHGLYKKLNELTPFSEGSSLLLGPLHRQIDKLLNDSFFNGFNEKFEQTKALIEAGANINLPCSRHKTPLTMVCHFSVDWLMSTQNLSVQSRETAEKQIIEIIDYLLSVGANPNFPGQPSTPLLTLLYKKEPKPEELDLIKAIINKLIAAKADPTLPPPDHDLSRFKLSPLEYAKQHHPSLVSILTPIDG